MQNGKRIPPKKQSLTAYPVSGVTASLAWNKLVCSQIKFVIKLPDTGKLACNGEWKKNRRASEKWQRIPCPRLIRDQLFLWQDNKSRSNTKRWILWRINGLVCV